MMTAALARADVVGTGPAFPPAFGWPRLGGVLAVLARPLSEPMRLAGRPRLRGVDGDAAGGDFDAVVLPHLDAAFSLARYLTRDAAGAEDVTQDAMLKALRGFAGYRGGDPRAWLLAIVRRQHLDWRAAHRASSAVFAEPATPEDCEAAPDLEADGPEAILLRRDDVAAVRLAVEALPEPFRECLVLRELEELSYREISGVTGVPIGTVMSRLSRARDLLAQRLGAEARP